MIMLFSNFIILMFSNLDISSANSSILLLFSDNITIFLIMNSSLGTFFSLLLLAQNYLRLRNSPILLVIEVSRFCWRLIVYSDWQFSISSGIYSISLRIILNLLIYWRFPIPLRFLILLLSMINSQVLKVTNRRFGKCSEID